MDTLSTTTKPITHSNHRDGINTMRKNTPTTDETHKRPPATPGSAAAYWKAVANYVANVVAEADHYLPDHTSGLDEDSRTEIYNALVQARVACDTAYGAYDRVASAEHEATQRASAHGQPTGQYQQVRGYAQSAQWGW